MSKGRNVTVEIEFKEGVTAEIKAFIAPPEPSVGIMGGYVSEWFISKLISCNEDEDGNTEEEKINTLHKWADAKDERRERIEHAILDSAT